MKFASLLLVIFLFANCNKKSDTEEKRFDRELEIKIFTDSLNVSSEYIIDSFYVQISCSIAPVETIRLSHNDTSLLFGVTDFCCPALPDIPPIAEKFLIIYGADREQVSSIKITSERVEIDGESNCEILDAESESTSNTVNYDGETIFLEIYN